ncbi:MAG: helix-hairpin-helix domain-containing protein [Terrisporobacter sp.]|uniref:helix-hairpin-helix domain-containing protein n=1 Tax=Terrisporobacter sp. TaxID=1965305 RepID=UPI002FC9069A
MDKKKKMITFFLILLIPLGILIIKENLGTEEGIYVLSEEEENQDDISQDNISNENKDNVSKDNKENISPEEVTVYISGAVKTPGIVTLKKGDRLANAVEKVGGTTKSADLNKINMAIRLEDEQHYIIPKVGEEIEVLSNEKVNEKDGIVKGNNESSKININKASIEELDEIPGVGEATANKIVNYRNESGEFKSIEEIKNVNGIGDKKYEDMKDLISIE